MCGWMFQATDTFKSKYFITLYYYIYVYYTYKYVYYTYKYVSYTYFTVYVEVFVCFEITSGVSFFVPCAPVMLFMRTQICIMTWV